VSEPKQEVNFLDRIVGRKKKMYLIILQFIAEGFTEEETAVIVSKIFNCHLTDTRINQIKKMNRQLLDELTMQTELATKAGRIRTALRVIKKKRNYSLEDVLDWMKYLRIEIEGEKGTEVKVGIGVNVNGNGHFTGEDAEHSNRMRDYLRTGINGNGKHNGNTI
jgi:hypothetical protein